MPETSDWGGFSIFLYKYAARYAGDKTVLDLGCGIGKGVELLSKFTKKEVLGIDKSSRAIKQASSLAVKNSVFLLMEIGKISDLNRRFGLITMFSTIEHLSRKQQVKALSNISNLLEDNGVFIISTNNKLYTQTKNPFHKSELDVQEFCQLVNPHFKAVFLGINQKTNPKFRKNGFGNRAVSFMFRSVFMQEIAQPLIPKSVKDCLNSSLLHLVPPKESDFFFADEIEKAGTFFAVCRKK